MNQRSFIHDEGLRFIFGASTKRGIRTVFLAGRSASPLQPVLFLFVIVLFVACTPDETPVVERIPSETPFVFPTATYTPWPSPTHTSAATARPTRTHTPTQTAVPTDTPFPMVDLVMIVQPVPAGYPIPPEAVQVYAWPQEITPFGSITTLADVVNQVALVDLFCYQPVLESLIARRTVGTDYFPLPDRCPPVPQIRPPFRYTEVAFAVEYIDIGQTMTPEMIAFRPWPRALAPEQAVHGFMDVVGKTSRVEILQEQPLLLDYFR